MGARLGYSGYRPNSAGEEAHEIHAIVLHSAQLNENWNMLDEFEGSGYKRILACYESEDETQGLGYIYAINE